MFWALPNNIRLEGGDAPAVGVWLPLSPKLPEWHLFSDNAAWRQGSDGAITLRWDNRYSGIQVSVAPAPGVPGTWIGTAATFWDFPNGESAKWTARLERAGE
jgi:hypothetical protein